MMASFRRSAVSRVTLFAVLPITLTACGGGGNAGGGTSSQPPPASTYSVSGRAQKGPFGIGSEITINALDPTLSATGTVYGTQTNDALGDFSLSKIATAHVEIVAEGFYIDDLTGQLSASQIQLRSISDLGVNGSPTVNVLTTLQEQRLKTLISQGGTFAAADSQSQSEVLALFGIDAGSINSLSTSDSMRIDGTSDEDAVLLAVSVILSQIATDSAKANGTTQAAELSNLVNTIAAGIANTGSLTGTTFIPAKNLANTEINAASVTSNLQTYYSNNDVTVTAPPFIEWVDQTNSGVLPQRLAPVTGFSFSSVTTAYPGQAVTSNSVAVAGAGAGVYVKISASAGAAIIKNGVTVNGQLAIAQDGDTFALQVTALGYNQGITSTLSVGSISAQWDVSSVPLGGTISGVTGTGLVLEDNVGDTAVVGAGSTTFSFPTSISIGQPFGISVATAPTSPLQSCAIMNGSGTVGAAETAISVSCSAVSEIALIANSVSNNVSVYAIDGSNGALAAVPGSPFQTGATPKSVAVDATGQYALVANYGASTISVYAINAATGSLTPVAGSPFSTGSEPTGVTVNAAENVAYVPNVTADTISAYSIDASNGSLTAVSGSPFATPLVLPGYLGQPTSVGNLSPAVVDQVGSYLYVSYGYEYPLTNFANGVLAYSISSGSGELTLLSGNPYLVRDNCECAIPIAIAANGSFAYSDLGANLVNGDIFGYSIDAATGVPSALAASPFVASGAGSIAIDPTSRFLYAADDVDIALLAYTIDSSSGSLSPISGSPYATGGEANCSGCSFLPALVSIDPSGKYLYVQSELTASSSIITAFSINSANGSLTAVLGSPFAVGSDPTGLIAVAFAPIP